MILSKKKEIISKKTIVCNGQIFQLWHPKFLFRGITETNHTSIFKRIKKFKPIFKFRPKKIKKGIWITHDWTDAYYHWFADALPRLMLAEDSINVHQLPVLLPDYYQQHSFITDSLTMLGYQPYFLESGIPYIVDKLYITSMTAVTGQFNSIYIGKVRSSLTEGKNQNTDICKKIYISRSKAKKRFVANEKELSAFLSSLGFQIVHFENYSLEQQIKIVSESKVIIGLHGAGLTNMLFLPKQSTVFELISKEKNWYNWCYQNMANALNLKYYQIECETSKAIEDYNVYVDLKQLHAVLTSNNIK